MHGKISDFLQLNIYIHTNIYTIQEKKKDKWMANPHEQKNEADYNTDYCYNSILT